MSALSAGRPGSGHGHPGEPPRRDTASGTVEEPADLFVANLPPTGAVELLTDGGPRTSSVDLRVDTAPARAPRRPSHRRRVVTTLVVAAAVVALGAVAIGFLLTSGGQLSAIGLNP